MTDLYPIAPDDRESAAAGWQVRWSKKSEHPLARAVLELAKERGMDCGDLTEFTAVPGNGLTGRRGTSFLAGGN